jgi:hypothetical protein
VAGPTNRLVTSISVEAGEAQVQYAPSSLAYRVVNLERTEDGTVRAVRGFCPYEVDRDPIGNYDDQYGPPSLPGGPAHGSKAMPDGYDLLSRLGARVYGVFHASLLRGKAPTMIARAGTALYMQAGWRRAWKLIYEGLTDEGRPGFPDQWAVVNDNIVWSNGIDPSLVIKHNGMVVPLGFDRGPGAPAADGPGQPSGSVNDYRNSQGYSWPGRIGTVGDFVDNNDGALLAGRWTYATMWEDIHGNLSPQSQPSKELVLATQRANATVRARDNTVPQAREIDESTSVDDLPRQFVVKTSGEAPQHAVKTWILRTADANRNAPDLRRVESFSGTAASVYADNIPDSRLGAPAPKNVPVPRFQVMVSHAGGLVIADGPRVLRSEVGFPGSFPAGGVVVPAADGADVTALASHMGRLLAFSRRSVADITDPNVPPVTMAKGVGCEAPRSIQSLPDGTLIWLSRDGFYGWRQDKGIMLLSKAIHRLIRNEVARGAMRNAVSAVDPESGEYRCAVTPAGTNSNRLILSFDGEGWREIDYGVDITDMCVTDDARHYVLFSGRVTHPLVTPLQVEGALTTEETVSDVFVMGREHPKWLNPERTYRYLSAWLKGDEVGLTKTDVGNLYLGMVDEGFTTLTVAIHQDGSRKPDADATTREAYATGTGLVDVLGDEISVTDDFGEPLDPPAQAILGTARAHTRRLFWRSVNAKLESVGTWAFDLSSTSPFHLAALALETSQATLGEGKRRAPGGKDV